MHRISEYCRQINPLPTNVQYIKTIKYIKTKPQIQQHLKSKMLTTSSIQLHHEC